MEIEEIKTKIMELMEMLPIHESGDFNIILNAYELRKEMNDALSSDQELTDQNITEFKIKKEALELMIELNKIIRTTWAGLSNIDKEEFIAPAMGIKKLLQYRKTNATAKGQDNNRLHVGTGEDIQPGKPDQ